MALKSFQEKALFEFGPFRLDAAQRLLLRGAELIPLAPKAFDTLLALVQSEGRILDKTELLRRVWPDTFVEEGSLTQNISILRKALGNGDGQQYIQTIPKRGYRFVAEVQTKEELPAGGKGLSRWGFAAGAIVLAAFALWLWQRTRVKPLTDRDVVVLADFTNATGDSVFDGTLRDALAFQLEQSPFLKVLDDAAMRQDLRLMRRSPQERITGDLTHDICVREADKAMLSGSIATFGKSYVLELQAVQCDNGKTLARQEARAADKDHVLPALATAAQGVRAQLGESLTSIEKLAPPPAAHRVTTSSLEAFQDFHTGADFYRQGRYSEAVPFLQRATELDPGLAFGWTWLAVAYYNSGGRREVFEEYGNRAWALRDSVSAYERLWITSSRDGQTIGQYVDNYETWARTYPRDALPLLQLGRIHVSSGEFEAALEKFLEAYRLQSRRAIDVTPLIDIYVRLDRFADARAIAEKMFAQGEDAPMLHRGLLAMAYAEEDPQAAAKQIEWFRGKPEEYLSLADQAAEARTRGELHKSRELLAQAAALARARNLPDAASGFLKPNATGDALLGNCATSRQTGGLSDAILALCGNPALAARAEQQNQRWTPGIFKNPAQVPLTRGAAELGLGHPGKAIELLEPAIASERAWLVSNYIRGLAYLRLKKGAEAAAEFQKILDHKGANWGPMYPLSYVGLARGAAMAGDTEQAREAFGGFFALWKDADPSIPILIQARREYAALAR